MMDQKKLLTSSLYEAFLKSFFQFDKLAFERFRNSPLFLAKSWGLTVQQLLHNSNRFSNLESDDKKFRCKLGHYRTQDCSIFLNYFLPVSFQIFSR